MFVSEPDLSLPQSEFQHEVPRHASSSLESENFTGCSLLHRLLIIGREDLVLQRKEELSPSLLSHTCAFAVGWTDNYIIKKVNVNQFSPSDHKSPTR